MTYTISEQMFEIGEIIFQEESDCGGGEIGMLENKESELGLREGEVGEAGRGVREGARGALGQRVGRGKQWLGLSLGHYFFEFV